MEELAMRYCHIFLITPILLILSSFEAGAAPTYETEKGVYPLDTQTMVGSSYNWRRPWPKPLRLKTFSSDSLMTRHAWITS
jgi:hypothetical protein